MVQISHFKIIKKKKHKHPTDPINQQTLIQLLGKVYKERENTDLGPAFKDFPVLS